MLQSHGFGGGGGMSALTEACSTARQGSDRLLAAPIPGPRWLGPGVVHCPVLKAPPASADAWGMNANGPADEVVEPTNRNADTQSTPGEESLVASARVARVRKRRGRHRRHRRGGLATPGVERRRQVGRSSIEFIHPDDHQVAVESWMQLLGAHGPARPVKLRHKHSDGSWIWVEMTNHNLLDDPAHSCVVAEMAVISGDMAAVESLPASKREAESQPRRLHEALRDREQVLRRLSEALPLGVMQVDAGGRIVSTNHCKRSPVRRSGRWPRC